MERQQLATYVATFAVIAVVLALRWRRMSRARPLKVERLWVFPAVFAVVVALLYAQHPPVGWAWAVCALALLLGAALGWQRGKLMRLTVDPASGTINQVASRGAILFILVLIALRTGARLALAEGGGPLHLDALAVTNVLMALALGLFAAQRVEMYLRATRLLATRAAPPG